MIRSNNRREFFRAGAAAAVTSSVLGGSARAAQTAPPAVRLGIASYSLREFSRLLAIQYARQLGVNLIAVKDMHLPMGPADQVRKGSEEFQKAGLTITGLGVISLQEDNDDDMRRKFDYARAAGVGMIIGAPTKTTLARMERFVREYNIKVAIHNHGPEDPHFPSPLDVLPAIQSLDARIGLCLDVGHAVRAGAKVPDAIRAAGARLFDMHIKDLARLNDDKSAVPVGDGAIPIAPIFAALMAAGYQGQVMLEYEIDADNPVPGMMKSLAYMRGVLAGLGYRTPAQGA